MDAALHAERCRSRVPAGVLRSRLPPAVRSARVRVTLSLRARGLDAVVLDIEGTTTPLAFVHETLFPFARRALEGFIREQISRPEAAPIFRNLRADWLADVGRGDRPPPWPDQGPDDRQVTAIVGYAAWLMDRDRKAFGLKELQGLIWQRGYRDGSLRGEVYADVPDALRRWHEGGIAVAIYSSGSVLAQQLLFRSTPFGDLTPYIDAHFDTSVGAKRDSDSYRRIAEALGRTPTRVLFISDVPAELAAARQAGCTAILCMRPGNLPATDTESLTDLGAIR
jgi:enolase-phosphatase E1